MLKISPDLFRAVIYSLSQVSIWPGQQHKDCVRLMKTTISCGVLKATENKSILLFKTKDKSVPELTLWVNFSFPLLSILLFKVILLSLTKDLVVKVGKEHYSINGNYFVLPKYMYLPLYINSLTYHLSLYFISMWHQCIMKKLIRRMKNMITENRLN